MTDWQQQHRAELRAARANATAERLRSLAWFLLAGIYAVFAQQFAGRAATLLGNGVLFPLASRVMLLALLLGGFSAMGVLGQRQAEPVGAMGLPRRPGLGREWALGAALGWAGIVACVLPVALTGGLLVTIGQGDAGAVGGLVLDILTLLLSALTDELIFRGYPFQRLIAVTGPSQAAIVMAVLFTVVHGGLSAGGSLSTLLLGFLLAMAYLRTRALWLGWGLHFGWNASMAVLFGLPASGVTGFSPILSTYTSGPAWLTGGGYGPEGSALAAVVLVGLLVVTALATRELRYRWALPEIVGAGIPVEIYAMQQQQHALGMGSPSAAAAPAGSTLVQIAPAALPPAELPPGE